MRLTFVNSTNDSISLSRPSLPRGFCGSSQVHDDAAEEIAHIGASTTEDAHLNGRWDGRLLFKSPKSTGQQAGGEMGASKERLLSQEAHLVRIPIGFGPSWRKVNIPEHCPWNIYCVKVAANYSQVVILKKRNMSSFLSDLPDNLPLSAVVLPGTHDTMAFYGYPVSQCQSPLCSLSTQFLMGIRVIDIRLSIIHGQLIAYHGVYPQRTPFSTILASVNAFLTSPQGCRETIVMSIKQEDFARNSYLLFSKLVKECLMANPGGWKEPGNPSDGMWFLENRVPKLGEVRGKAVLFSRFGGNGEGWERGLEGMGIHPLVWPDSSKEGFEWYCKGTLVKTHDWYNIPSFLSIPEKVALSTRILIPDVHPNDSDPSLHTPHYNPVYISPIPPQPPLAMTFLSAASFPLSLPPTIARGFGWPRIGLGIEGVNSRVGRWLLGILGGESPVDLKRNESSEHEKQEVISLGVPDPRIRGWVLMDYYNEPEGLVPLLVECNFRGRRPGEEGWPR